MHGDDLHSLKDLKDRRAGHVAGMDDDIATLEAVTGLHFKPAVWSKEMGIGKNACSSHFGKGAVKVKVEPAM